jgi:hypothetical protein
LAALEESRALNDVERLKALFPTALTPLFEANDLVTIHRGLRDAGLESYIKTRMQKIVSGPRTYIDEDPAKGSNEARNVTFELMVAERLHTGGLVLDPTLRADVAVKVGNRRALIECKRPQSERQVAQRVVEARDQLKRSYQSALRPGCYGLIAIDLTKLSNPDFGIMTGVKPGEVGMVMTKHIDDFYHENSSVWARVQQAKTAGVVFRLSVLAHLGDDTVLTWCQQYAMVVFPERDPAARSVAEAIEAALRSATAREGTLWF